MLCCVLLYCYLVWYCLIHVVLLSSLVGFCLAVPYFVVLLFCLFLFSFIELCCVLLYSCLVWFVFVSFKLSCCTVVFVCFCLVLLCYV